MELSKRTQARLMELLDRVNATFEASERRQCDREKFVYMHGFATSKYWSRILYEHDIPDWMTTHADKAYHYNWDGIVRDLANGKFCVTAAGGFLFDGELVGQDYIEAGQ